MVGADVGEKDAALLKHGARDLAFVGEVEHSVAPVAQPEQVELDPLE